MIALVWILRAFAEVRFSDKEKDEASAGICFVRQLLNAFIPPLCGDEGFFILSLRRHIWSPTKNIHPGTGEKREERSVMRKCWCAIGCIALAQGAFAQFATSVISYNAGTGAQAGYNDATAALGMPTVSDGFGGVVDPTNPPWRSTELVSIGAGGSLTVGFGTPIRNDVANPFGVDFIVYGNAFFVFDFESGRTDGNLFGSTTPTRISVSSDNVNYFTLDTSLASSIDSYFPTDGAGTFGMPVDPSLANPGSFANHSLSEIRAKYAGSGGGAGFDLAWARDGNGNAVSLDAINFVRVEVLSGKAEVDAFAAVPEPSTWGLLGLGAAALTIRKRRA